MISDEVTVYRIRKNKQHTAAAMLIGMENSKRMQQGNKLSSYG